MSCDCRCYDVVSLSFMYESHSFFRGEGEETEVLGGKRGDRHVLRILGLRAILTRIVYQAQCTEYSACLYAAHTIGDTHVWGPVPRCGCGWLVRWITKGCGWAARHVSFSEVMCRVVVVDSGVVWGVMRLWRILHIYIHTQHNAPRCTIPGQANHHSPRYCSLTVHFRLNPAL